MDKEFENALERWKSLRVKMANTTLVWYDIRNDEIFLDWIFDRWFYQLAGDPEKWQWFECLGEL